MDLTTATPVEIDTVLAALDSRLWGAGMDRVNAIDALHYTAGDKRGYGRFARWTMTLDEAVAAVRAILDNDATHAWDRRNAQTAMDRYDAACAAVAAVKAEIAPLDAEFVRRGGWTRAFIVAGGHVHSSRECSTCNRDGKATAFGWVTSLSGHDEAEIVEKAGERACTVCYPTAPVESLGRPSSLFHADEVAAEKARAEREQAKADRTAKKIANGLTEDGSEFVIVLEEGVYGADYWHAPSRGKAFRRTESFKTEKAAVMWVVGKIADTRSAWRQSPLTDAEQRGIDQVLDAVARKHGKTRAEVDAEIEVKVAAKVKRDSR